MIKRSLRSTWLVIILSTLITYLAIGISTFMRIGTPGGLNLVVIGFITGFVNLCGILVYWHSNRTVAIGFLGSLLSIFVLMPVIIVFIAWLLLRNVYF